MLSNLWYIFFLLSWSSDSCFRYLRCSSDAMLSIPIWFGSSKVAAILIAFVLLLVIRMTV